ncbi:MAG: lipid II flippase MurJ [Ilumatobacteraceae bacterium]
MVFAIVMGQTALADAYNGANNTPNAIYELLLGGVLSAALVPMFSRQAEDDDDEATSAVLSVALLVDRSHRRSRGGAVSVPPLSPSTSPTGWIPTSTGAPARPSRAFPGDLLLRRERTRQRAKLQARRRYFAALVGTGGGRMQDHRLAADGARRRGRPRARSSWRCSPTIGCAGRRWCHDRHRGDGVRGAAGAHLRTYRCTSTLGSGPGAAVAEVVGVDVRLRGRLTRWRSWWCRTSPTPAAGTSDAYSKAYIFFVLPHGLLAMSIVTTFTPEMSRRGSPRIVRPSSIAPDGRAHVALTTCPAAKALMFVLRCPLIGMALEHGNFDAADAAHQPSARRIRPRSRRVRCTFRSCCARSTRTPTPGHPS